MLWIILVLYVLNGECSPLEDAEDMVADDMVVLSRGREVRMTEYQFVDNNIYWQVERFLYDILHKYNIMYEPEAEVSPFLREIKAWKKFPSRSLPRPMERQDKEASQYYEKMIMENVG